MGAKPAAVISAACDSVVRPVVIRPEECAILVAKFQRRILERVRDAKRAEARSQAANDDAVVALVIPEDESGNDDIAAGAEQKLAC